MKDRSPEAHRCPICGNEQAFTALVARIRAVQCRQASAGSWKTVTPEAARHDGYAVLAFVCENCAHPTTTPVSVISRIVKGATRTPRKRRGRGAGS